jgi:hypothetical protein
MAWSFVKDKDNFKFKPQYLPTYHSKNILSSFENLKQSAWHLMLSDSRSYGQD